MIIEARGDVVTLRGRLSENHWPAIAAAVDLLLPEHPQGILLDCSSLTSITDMGGATFIEGLNYMELRGARILLCSVPPTIDEHLRSIPGLHSQVPTAPTVEAGRLSLAAGGSAPLTARGSSKVVLVPVNPPFSRLDGLFLDRLRNDSHIELHLVYGMAVPRSLPIGAPLPEEESRADTLLKAAEGAASSTRVQRHISRGRNVPDAIIDAARRLSAAEIWGSLGPETALDESVGQMLETLRQRTPCPLLMIQEPSSGPAIGS